MSVLFKEFTVVPKPKPVDRLKQLNTRRKLKSFGFSSDGDPDFEWPTEKELALMPEHAEPLSIAEIDFYRNTIEGYEETVAALQIRLSNGMESPFFKNPHAKLGAKTTVKFDFKPRKISGSSTDWYF